MRTVFSTVALLLLGCAVLPAQQLHPAQPAQNTPVAVAPMPKVKIDLPAVKVVKQDEPAQNKFKTGLKGRSPAHKILTAPRFFAGQSLLAPPAQFATVAPQLRMWGNDQYGDCVSAEEAMNLATTSFRCTGKEVCPTDAEVISFARKYGYLNGAYLTEVMDTMQQHGMTVSGMVYKIGPYASVDYTVPTTLQAAIFAGPVNIAIDSRALPSSAGGKNGWYATKGGHYGNTDHCVDLVAYGTADYLYKQLNMPLPAALPADTQGYLLFTWSSLGFVTQDWLNGTCSEAWVRNPSIVGMTPPAPTPDPTPGPTPPPGPGPNPVPSGGDFTVTTVEVFQNGQRVSSKSTVSANGTSHAANVLESELRGVNINAAVIADLMQLFNDVKGKKGILVILADVTKLLNDLQAPPAP